MNGTRTPTQDLLVVDAYIADLRRDAGWVGARHSHPRHQLVYVVSGAIRVDVGGKVFDAHSGDSFIVDGGVEHQASALEPSEVLDVFTPTREDYRELIAPVTGKS